METYFIWSARTVKLKSILWILAWWLSIAGLSAQSLVTKMAFGPIRIGWVIYYDNDFLFVTGERTDGPRDAQEKSLVLLVHSKAHNAYRQIVSVSTKGGSFGSSHSENPAEMQILMRSSIGWNNTGLAKVEYAEIPLRGSGAIAFPDQIRKQDSGRVYRLGFNTSWGVSSAATYLYIQREDLVRAFDPKP